MYYALEGYLLVAADATTGTQKWTYTTGTSGVNSYVHPVIADGVVYTGGGGYMYALNEADGQLKWKSQSKGSVSSYTGIYQEFSAAFVANGKVYAGAGDNITYALNTSDGTQAWTYGSVTTKGGRPGPAVYNNVAYVNRGDSKLYAIDGNTGSLLWAFNCDGITNTEACVMDNKTGKVYLCSNIGQSY